MNEFNNLIGLCSKKRCGKDTVADIICNNNNFAYEKYAMAEPIKYLICKHFGISNNAIEGIGYNREELLPLRVVYVAEKFMSMLREMGYSPGKISDVDWNVVYDIGENNFSLRTLMQSFGTDVGCNQVDQMIWVKPMLKVYEEFCSGSCRSSKEPIRGLVVSDVRQPWEIEALRERNALIIHIENPHVKSEDKHSTENGVKRLENEPVVINDFNPIYSDDLAYCKVKMEVLEEKVKNIVNNHNS